MVNDAHRPTTSAAVESGPVRKPEVDGGASLRSVTVREWVAVFVLCFVNLINYMDRFTIAGKARPVFVYLTSPSRPRPNRPQSTRSKPKRAPLAFGSKLWAFYPLGAFQRVI
jgi:hypothetical protein